MASEEEALLSRRLAQRRVQFWRAAAVVMLILLGLSFYGASRLPLTAAGPHIGRLDVEGVIAEDWRRGQMLAQFAEEENGRALLVRINSPGGTVVGGESLYRALRRIAEKKPVAVIMGEVATSAGYMAALGGERIFAHQGTVTGSIGVILLTANISGALEKLGITTETFKSGALKAAPNPVEPVTAEVRAATFVLIHDIHDFFLQLVAERRGLDDAAIADLADGRAVLASAALDAGLIDAIGDETDALAWLESQEGVGEDLEVIDVEESSRGYRVDIRRYGDALLTLLGWTAGAQRALSLDGLVSIWSPLASDAADQP